MKRLYFFIFLLIYSNSFSQINSYEESVSLFEKGDYDGAIELSTKAIKSNHSDCAAFLVRGASYHKKGESALALDDLLYSVKCDSTKFMAYSYLADVYVAYGDLDMALASYSKSIALNNKYFFNFLDRAICKKELGRYEDAISDLKLAISIDSTDQEAFALLGEIYFRMGKFENAFDNLSKAVAISQNGLNTTLLGLAQGNLGNFTEAIELFTKALEYKDVNKAGVLVYRGQMYLRISKMKEACLDFEAGYKLGDLEGLSLQKKHCN